MTFCRVTIFHTLTLNPVSHCEDDFTLTIMTARCCSLCFCYSRFLAFIDCAALLLARGMQTADLLLSIKLYSLLLIRSENCSNPGKDTYHLPTQLSTPSYRPHTRKRCVWRSWRHRCIMHIQVNIAGNCLNFQDCSLASTGAAKVWTLSFSGRKMRKSNADGHVDICAFGSMPQK